MYCVKCGNKNVKWDARNSSGELVILVLFCIIIT